MTLRFRFFGLSDIGLARPNNEDVWAAHPESGFFALADGMGGHVAGEVAAGETIEHLSKIFQARHLKETFSASKEEFTQEMMDLMQDAIESANEWVYRMSKEYEEYSGMGTTLCCLYWTLDAIIYAHVGDSRIYRLRDNELALLTEDHSLLTKWLKMGKKAEECKTRYPYKNVITKAIGTHPKSHPEIAVIDYEPNDLFILCTDGLSDVLSNEEIKNILCKGPDLTEAAKMLIAESKFKGSHDNITVLIVQCEGAHAKDLFRQQFNHSLGSSSRESLAR